MTVELLFVLPALAGLALAAYAHARLAFHTATRLQAELVRVVLVATGLAVGWLGMRWPPETSFLGDLLTFVAGFGLVHLPAAFILWSKRQRGVYR
jgi:hypothetical protein